MARMIGYVLATFLLWSALVCGNSFADAPKLVNYQGYLTDSVGAPITGTRSMVFGLYNAASAGSLLWSETQASVPVSNGIYQVNLGSVTPLNLSFDQQYYLGIAVGGDPEMTPRQPLTSAPYALGLAPGSTVTLSDSASNSAALSVTTNSTTAVALAVTKNGLYGNGASFVLNEPSRNLRSFHEQWFRRPVRYRWHGQFQAGPAGTNPGNRQCGKIHRQQSSQHQPYSLCQHQWQRLWRLGQQRFRDRRLWFKHQQQRRLRDDQQWGDRGHRPCRQRFRLWGLRS